MALQENVTEDGETNTRVGLDTSDAGVVSRISVVDQRTGDSGSVRADGNAEVGKIGRAVKDVTTGIVIILCATDLRVVSRNDTIIKKKQCGSGISNSIKASARLATDFVAIYSEAPESLRAINAGIGD